jgi:hypothetical protein
LINKDFVVFFCEQARNMEEASNGEGYIIQKDANVGVVTTWYLERSTDSYAIMSLFSLFEVRITLE